MAATAVPPKVSPAPRDRGIRPRRWTREEYYRAAELGLFRPEERLELLDGEIIEKVSPQNPPHAQSLARTADTLRDTFGAGHYVRQQMPLILGPRSEPEPDVAVVRGTRDDYPLQHPTAADTLLLVEVSDTTLRLDRRRKLPAYARAGIPEYWILNLPQRQLEVYRDAVGSRYQTTIVLGEQETVTPLAAPHTSIRVADLLPPSAPPQTP